LTKSKLHVGHLFAGVAFEQDEKIEFNSFCFSVEGLDEWIELTGIGVQCNSDTRSFDLSFSPIDPITCEIIDGLNLEIFYTYMLPGPPFLRTTEITQQAFLKIRSREAKELPFFQQLAHKITNLLSLAIDQTVAMQDVTCFSDEIVVEPTTGKYSVPIKLFYRGRSFLDRPPKIRPLSMLFRFCNVRDFGTLILNWLRVYELLRPSIELYFSTRQSPYSFGESRFLSLAQAVESLHRRTSDVTQFPQEEFETLVMRLVNSCDMKYQDWLAGKLEHLNEVSLNKRLKQIIHPYKKHFGSSSEREKLVRGIVNSRNFFTHYNESLRSKAASGETLSRLCLKLEAILQLSFLNLLEFSEAELDAIIKNSRTLKFKIGTPLDSS
jgi:hypothetical protein